MATGASLMLLAVVVATVQTASGHGYISEPPARNALSGESCPHCLNAGGIKITDPAPGEM
jgi:predicted carbohydrate-binding protein with CBM5 and CBM33 domain